MLKAILDSCADISPHVIDRYIALRSAGILITTASLHCLSGPIIRSLKPCNMGHTELQSLTSNNRIDSHFHTDQYLVFSSEMIANMHS